jgi:hypothetical protein
MDRDARIAPGETAGGQPPQLVVCEAERNFGCAQFVKNELN